MESSFQIFVTTYVNDLITLYQNYKTEFDHEIVKKLKNWEFSRVAVIDKVILRMAMVELLYFEDIPPQVSINEAIELAKKYSTARSDKFINGLLDAIYKQLNEENKINKQSQ